MSENHIEMMEASVEEVSKGLVTVEETADTANSENIQAHEVEDLAEVPNTDTDTDTDADADANTLDENPPETDEVQALKDEITRLRALIDKKQKEQDRITSELGEFYRLFPDVSTKDIPSTVWSKVEGGLPLSAAYALYEKEESIRRARAGEVNSKNHSLSPGMAGKDTSYEYFSPEEVKCMSQKEVHENYERIKNSMKFWR